jgi:hypothetical protein
MMKRVLVTEWLFPLLILALSPSLAIAQAKYVGSAKCMPCHKAVYELRPLPFLVSHFLFPIYHFQLQLFLILLRRPDSKDLLQQLPFPFQHLLF